MAYEVIDHIPEVNPNQTGEIVHRENLKGTIEFKNVNFEYPTRKDLRVLKNFSTRIEAGQTVALVGPSGSGKSTIIQLIERFYNPSSTHGKGEILIDGKPIESYDLRSLRHCIGYVSQEPVLFNTTIRENLLFANPEATE